MCSVAEQKNIFRKGRGLGRGGLGIGPDRRLADDGKRLDPFEFALAVAFPTVAS